MNKPVEQMKWWGWGREQTTFDIDSKPALRAFVKTFGDFSDEQSQFAVALDDIVLSEAYHQEDFMRVVAGVLATDQISCSHKDRVVHAYGKSFRDLWRIRRGMIDKAPDCVLYPTSNQQVQAIVAAAHQYGVVIIPFGGGSNIVGCLEARKAHGRMVVSLDMKRMQRVLSIDKHSRIAVIQAGAMGPWMEEQLKAEGFTLGHFPDSFEHSTVGGWVATRSAGMQSDQYGKIEDMVIALQVVTPVGELVTRTVPKSSNGINVNHMMIGSEGILGVITEVTLQVHRLPERRSYDGFMFPDFESGAKAIYECVQKGCMPVMTRLNDPGKTQLSFAFKSQSGALPTLVSKMVKWYLANVKKIDFNKCCLMLTIFEGDRVTYGRLKKRVTQIYRRHGGIYLGQGPGKAFARGKYDFPYTRDYFMDRDGIADVSETATTWENLLPLYRATMKSLQTTMAQYQPKNFMGCHISHTYHAGASLYFTFGTKQKEGCGLSHYLAIKKAVQDSFMAHGATLSHHHAVGWEHQPWLEQDISTVGVVALKGLKDKLDPNNIMNPGKIIPSEGLSHDWSGQRQQQGVCQE